MKLPGLSLSWKRALGITQAKQQFARQTGIPTTKVGLERKIGKAVIKTLLGNESYSAWLCSLILILNINWIVASPATNRVFEK